MARRRRNGGSRSGTAITIIATIVCMPCICVIGVGIFSRELFRAAKEYENPKKKASRIARERKNALKRATPKPLEPRLERNLTIGRKKLNPGIEVVDVDVDVGAEDKDIREKDSEKDGSGDVDEKGVEEIIRVEKGGRTDQQKQSLLFQLPTEVRRQIWEETLGGYLFHMYYVDAYRRMAHTRCKHNHEKKALCMNESELVNLCRMNIKQPGNADEWGHTNMLSILQSCRRIYSEGIEILYTHNWFEFLSHSDVLRLSLCILPERMPLITHVQWKPSHNMPYMTTMPWLDCRLPSACGCVKCWAKATRLLLGYTPLQSQQTSISGEDHSIQRAV